jgi:OOP family OmpA-OmpF porin
MRITWGIATTSMALLLVMSQPSARADDDTGWYVGVSLNRLNAEFKDRDDKNFDDTDDAFGIKGGYMFNNYFGVEAGYMDLGSYKGGSGIEIDANGWNLAAVGNWPVSDKWDLYGKLGAFAVDADSDQFIPGIGRVKKGEDETEFYGAIGAEYDFGQWNIFGEFCKVDT